MPKKVYIASPYTIGDKLENVDRQLQAANKLIEWGYIPFIPLLYHFYNERYSKDYEIWMKLDFEWIRSCNYLIRLLGKSKGADREVEFARMNGKQIFYGIDDFFENIVQIDIDYK